MERKSHLFERLLFLLVFILPGFVYGQTEISNEAQLRAIANDLTGDYILTSDITLSEPWTPIGDDQNRFAGTIDGNGKTIYGLTFDNKAVNGVGFIGVADGAVIQNLNISGARMYGGQDVGGVIGRAYAPTTVNNCSSSGIIKGNDHVGGIIGGSKSSGSDNDMSKIDNCYSTAGIVSTGWQAGGIVGASVAIDVNNVYFAGIATCPSGRSAGIVAFADGGNTSINNSVSIAAYIKGDQANRIIGDVNTNASAFLMNNYSLTSTLVYDRNGLYVDGESDAYGVDGEHTDVGVLRSPDFYTGLNWSTSIWKFEDGNFPILSNQAYPIDADAIYFDPFPERSIPGNQHDTKAFSALGRTIIYASSNPSVATVDANGVVTFLANGFTEISFSTTGDTYSLGTTLTYDLEVQSISYNIYTEDDLKNIKYDLNGEFTLMNNITLTQPWNPIGTFKGKLNGNGKIIFGLSIDDQSTAKRGLFSKTEGAEISKLGIERAHIVGNEDIGAIIGEMDGGLIDQCYVTDSYIAGRDHVGSLVGAMRPYQVVIIPADPDNGIEEQKETRYSTISNCHAGAKIYSREYQAGGIAGIICGGTIEDCYFSGMLQAVKGRVGGIVSLVDSDDPGYVKNNVNLAVAGYCGESTYRIGDWGGRTPASSNYAVKFTNNWSKEQSYFGVDEANSAVQDGQKDDNRNGANLANDANALQQTFYVNTLGWDFTSKWKFITGTDGKMYPVLAWQQGPLAANVFGIPDPAYLIWTENSDNAIELNKINSTTGQQITFNVISGEQYVDLVGSLLYVTESNLAQGGWATIGLNLDASLSDKLEMDINSFDVEVLIDGAVIDISTVEQFKAINNKLFANFRLTQNIDMTGVDFYGIGSSDSPFTGALNGNGYSIINPVVKTNGENNKGLFNATQGAKIQQLGVTNISFSGSSKDNGVNIGGMVGSCKNTTIEESYVTGTITGADHVGGFVGGDADNVLVRNSYANVTISGGQQIGGFFGVSAGSVTLENCYFSGSLSALSRGWVGGMIGLIDKVGEIKITGCSSIGNLSSVETVGSIIGGNMTDNGVERGTISLFLDNLYNIDAIVSAPNSGWTLPYIVTGVAEDPIPMVANSFKQKSTYTNISWDFDNIWSIDESKSLPILKKVTPVTEVRTPVTDQLTYKVYSHDKKIYISGVENTAVAYLYNLNGQVVYHSSINNNSTIFVNEVGLYLLKIIEKERTSTIKILCK